MAYDWTSVSVAISFTSDFLGSIRIQKMMKDLAKKKAKRIIALNVDPFMKIEAEKADLDALRVGSQFSNNNAKESLFNLIKSACLEMARNRIQRELFVDETERWTLLSTFIDAFEKGRLISSGSFEL